MIQQKTALKLAKFGLLFINNIAPALSAMIKGEPEKLNSSFMYSETFYPGVYFVSIHSLRLNWVICNLLWKPKYSFFCFTLFLLATNWDYWNEIIVKKVFLDQLYLLLAFFASVTHLLFFDFIKFSICQPERIYLKTFCIWYPGSVWTSLSWGNLEKEEEMKNSPNLLWVDPRAEQSGQQGQILNFWLVHTK